jgi:hypothetical protein
MAHGFYSHDVVKIQLTFYYAIVGLGVFGKDLDCCEFYLS